MALASNKPLGTHSVCDSNSQFRKQIYETPLYLKIDVTTHIEKYTD